MQRILTEVISLHAYKMKLTEELADHGYRLECANWIIEHVTATAHFCNMHSFSDKARFHTGRYVSKQNYRICGRKNVRVIQEQTIRIIVWRRIRFFFK